MDGCHFSAIKIEWVGHEASMDKLIERSVSGELHKDLVKYGKPRDTDDIYECFNGASFLVSEIVDDPEVEIATPSVRTNLNVFPYLRGTFHCHIRVHAFVIRITDRTVTVMSTIAGVRGFHFRKTSREKWMNYFISAFDARSDRKKIAAYKLWGCELDIDGKKFEELYCDRL